MDLLYKPFLYCNEDEVLLYGVFVPSDFWEYKNISESYNSLFQQKLERSIYLMIEIKLRKELEDQIFEQFALEHDKKNKYNDIMLHTIDPIIKKTRDRINILIEDNLDDTSWYNYHSHIPVSIICQQLMTTDKISHMMSDFGDRLKSIQKTGSVLKFYEDSDSFSIPYGHTEPVYKDFDDLINQLYELEFTAFRLDRFIDIDIDFEELIGKYNYLHC